MRTYQRLTKWTLPCLAAAILSPAAIAIAARPARGHTIVERTANGYTMRFKVARSGQSGRLSLACPNGKRLGRSASFPIRHGDFAASRRVPGRRVFLFLGHFDSPTHVKGFGSIARGVCGAHVPQNFVESSPGKPRMLACPPNDPAHPYRSNTPFSFVGEVPAAAAGARVRIAYTDPNTAGIVVRRVKTNASGRFRDTHVFPAKPDGTVYTATVTPRYRRRGRPCSFPVQ